MTKDVKYIPAGMVLIGYTPWDPKELIPWQTPRRGVRVYPSLGRAMAASPYGKAKSVFVGE